MNSRIFNDLELEPKTKHQSQLTGIFGGAIGSGMKGQMQQQADEEEEWDEFQRFRDNRVKISHSKFCLYHRTGEDDQPIVYYESRPKLIKDPIDYEYEHKRRQIWSLRDIETFLQSILENPKNVWVVGKALSHKTSKDLIYFFQAFKKLFNLKKHFKTCFVLMGLPTQIVKKQAI